MSAAIACGSCSAVPGQITVAGELVLLPGPAGAIAVLRPSPAGRLVSYSPSTNGKKGDVMKRKLVQSVVAAAVLAGAVGVGSLVATAGAQAALSTGQQVVLQASKQLPASSPGLVYVKLLSAVTGRGPLSGRFAISSVTIAQFGGSQALEVSLRAATCDNANGFGALENVVVPQYQTVHLDYPKAVQMPFVATAPTSWCLYAETIADGGSLKVSVVATKLS